MNQIPKHDFVLKWKLVFTVLLVKSWIIASLWVLDYIQLAFLKSNTSFPEKWFSYIWINLYYILFGQTAIKIVFFPLTMDIIKSWRKYEYFFIIAKTFLGKSLGLLYVVPLSYIFVKCIYFVHCNFQNPLKLYRLS